MVGKNTSIIGSTHCINEAILCPEIMALAISLKKSHGQINYM
jgi:hypothetical protein